MSSLPVTARQAGPTAALERALADERAVAPVARHGAPRYARAIGPAVVALTNTLYEGMHGRIVADVREAVYGVDAGSAA
ncbi:hypothetical protein LGM65_02335 [Burkholderia anthina]|uniref:hypothetical protein n=1 Tax=Burkholderia anthina TaxID=179879 RepID=UPI001CF1DA1D|nr:hypothetical protein [Burkholderia anthina]MCA8089735.1 hypothetical protein [Burkholderia anthina]